MGAGGCDAPGHPTDWGKPEIISPFASSAYEIAPGVPETDAYDRYLLGSKSLSQDSYLDGLLRQGARYLVENDGWSNLPSAKSLPGSS